MVCHLFKRGGIWHAKVRLDSWATEKRLSLKTRDKRIASSKLEKHVHDLEMVEAGLLPPLSVREAAQAPLPSLLGAFLGDLKARDKSPKTVLKYGCLLRRLVAGCGWAVLRDVTTANFEDWRAASGLSPRARLQNLIRRRNSRAVAV